MASKKSKHIFTAELPYEKDAVVTKFLYTNFKRVDCFIMSLGQMTNIPPSVLHSYINGKKISTKTYTKNKLYLGGLRLYFLYIPKALFSVTTDLIRALKHINFKCDVFLAQHFLPAYIAVILRKLGILECKKIIYWSFDFFLIPPEISRSMYYRGIDKIQGYLRKNVDEIWYSTPRLKEVDLFRHGEAGAGVEIKLTEGMFFDRINTQVESSDVPPLKLAFLGSLRKNNAVYESVDAIEYALNMDLEVELHVIGSGPEQSRLNKYVENKDIQNKVIFYGFEDSGVKIAEIFSECHMGLALYPADPYGPNWYVTSGKFRRFISQSLPVITTTVPYFAKYIQDYGAGIVVDNNPESVYKSLKNIYDNPNLLDSYRKGVDALYQKYKGDKVLKEALDL